MNTQIIVGSAHWELINLIWCGLGTILAIPGAVAIARGAVTRMKAGAAIGAFLGAIAGFFVTLFIWGTALDSVHLEGAIVFAATIFIATVTGIIGALLVNFLFAGSPPVRNTQVEY